MNTRIPMESLRLLEQHPYALDRIDLRFRWGAYDLRVLRCHLAKFPAGHVIDHHQHSEFEFHFIPSGRGVVTIEGQRYTVGPGEFYLTGPGVDHRQEADEEDPMQELCLHIDIRRGSLSDADIEEGAGASEFEDWEAREAEECIRALGRLPTGPLSDRCLAMREFVHAYEAWHAQEAGSYTTIKQCVLQILIKAVRASFVTSGPAPLPSRDMSEFRFQLVKRFIQDNYQHPLRLDDVAARLHISGRQLQRVIKQHTGQGFSEYLETVRLTHIRRLLEQSGETLESIALRCGYTSGAYMHYAFKKKWGVTPGFYRDNIQQRRMSE